MLAFRFLLQPSKETLKLNACAVVEAVQFHAGDGHESAKIYRHWFNTHFSVFNVVDTFVPNGW